MTEARKGGDQRVDASNDRIVVLRIYTWIWAAAACAASAFLFSTCAKLDELQDERDKILNQANQARISCNKVREEKFKIEKDCAIDLDAYREWRKKEVFKMREHRMKKTD